MAPDRVLGQSGDLYSGRKPIFVRRDLAGEFLLCRDCHLRPDIGCIDMVRFIEREEDKDLKLVAAKGQVKKVPMVFRDGIGNIIAHVEIHADDIQIDEDAASAGIQTVGERT